MVSPRSGNCWTSAPSSSAFDPLPCPGGAVPPCRRPCLPGLLWGRERNRSGASRMVPLLCRPSRDCRMTGKPTPPGRQGRRQGLRSASPDKAKCDFSLRTPVGPFPHPGAVRLLFCGRLRLGGDGLAVEDRLHQRVPHIGELEGEEGDVLSQQVQKDLIPRPDGQVLDLVLVHPR